MIPSIELEKMLAGARDVLSEGCREEQEFERGLQPCPICSGEMRLVPSPRGVKISMWLPPKIVVCSGCSTEQSITTGILTPSLRPR